jgi:hypothetical protein
VLKEYKAKRFEKRQRLRQASEMRFNDLTKNGIRTLLQYGLREKAAREEKLRKAVIFQNMKRNNTAKKYAKIWINKMKRRRISNWPTERFPLYSIN